MSEFTYRNSINYKYLYYSNRIIAELSSIYEKKKNFKFNHPSIRRISCRRKTRNIYKRVILSIVFQNRIQRSRTTRCYRSVTTKWKACQPKRWPGTRPLGSPNSACHARIVRRMRRATRIVYRPHCSRT